MTSLASVSETIDQYGKHGWVLRRASLAPELIAPMKTQFPVVEFYPGAEQFLWFSRRSHKDKEAWELRRLSGPPFALVVVLEDSLSSNEREAILIDAQRRMFDGSHPEPTAH